MTDGKSDKKGRNEKRANKGTQRRKKGDVSEA